MKFKRKVAAVAIVAAASLLAATGGWMYVSEAQTPAPILTQAEFDHALQVIQQVGSVYFATSTTAPATTTTTTVAPATTTTAPATTTTTRAPVETLIKARIKRAADKGCQGIEPDLDDTWQGGPNGNTGFPITYDQNLAYNHRLADYAHSLSLTFGLKNAGGTAFVAASQPFTDWALNEQCNQYGECNYSPYINASKAVFQTEYTTNTSFCISDNSRNYDGLAKKTSLTAAYRVACRNG